MTVNFDVRWEWILVKPRRINRNATYKCPRCKKLCSSYYNDVGEWAFCPHCGAKMRKEQTMEKETVIKALECCSCSIPNCEDCNYDGDSLLRECYDNLKIDALALIKELTEENEKLTINMNAYGLTAKRLAEENERLKSISINKDITIEAINEVIKQLNEENERLKADVSVKKKLLDKCADLEDRVRADTVREFAERLKKECLVDSGYEVLQIGTIDHIAEEMLKSRECPQCKHFVGCEPSTLGVCDMYEKNTEDENGAN